ncbi:DUF1217 domain-containing protein [Poseidonocella sedimentorum]|uniref:Flagellar protein n=1 Tax=Poseidonocella sedimentorum TaxID=871652 RepID=A0A1I6DT13_9RHOB|nr:DUF1217 domain-containing protein [Poseidonocella sedimentorum]SFR08502.1 Protein of unknown function [Poseidonocella sedimentorum]
MSYTPSIVGSGISAYAYMQRTQSQQVQAFANTGQIARDLQHLEENIQKIETVDELMADRQLLRVALGAFGLQDDINNSGFIRRVLESDLNDSTSFANRLSDKKYQSLARTFNFGGNAQLPTADARDTIRGTLSSLSSPQALFNEGNERLLTQALEAFGIEGDEDRTVFLQRVISSDLDDPASLANRLEDKAYLAFAKAAQGVEPRVDSAFLSAVDDDIATRLEALDSADDLLSDRGLLRATLSVYGLEDLTDNTYYLKSVLESELSDPDSFANTQNDPRLAELAAVFDFQSRESEKASVYGFAEVFGDKLNSFATADDLLADEDALTAALTVFGLENDVFLDTESNLRAVLDSDLYDDASFANTLDDKRYAALANLFSFNEIAGGEDIAEAQSALNNMVETIESRGSSIKTGDQLIKDAGFMIATMSFFDLPAGVEGAARFNKVATSDGLDPLSFVNLIDDSRYSAFHKAMDFKAESADRTYPAGFARTLSEAYITRQFEVAVGNVDTSMRIAISMERELTDIVDSVSSNDARWFSVMSSTPLRTIFESAFNFPSSFAALDLERQLEDFKERSESVFGTSDLSILLKPEYLDPLRESYLSTTTGTNISSSTGSQIASILMAGG